MDTNIQNKTGTILENETCPSDCNHEFRGCTYNPQKCLSRLSDQDLRKVFFERFKLKTSEVITCNSKAAYHLSAFLNETCPSGCNHEFRGCTYNPQKCLSQLSDQDLHKVFCERFKPKTGEVITCSSKAAYHLSAFFIDNSKEKFGVIFLNGRNAFIHSEVLFEGTLTTTAVYQREIIKRALDLNAAAIIIGHNHPSGSVSPSLYDQEVTKTIKRACEAVEIRLHDHLIIGNDKWFSFSDHHML